MHSEVIETITKEINYWLDVASLIEKRVADLGAAATLIEGIDPIKDFKYPLPLKIPLPSTNPTTPADIQSANHRSMTHTVFVIDQILKPLPPNMGLNTNQILKRFLNLGRKFSGKSNPITCMSGLLSNSFKRGYITREKAGGLFFWSYNHLYKQVSRVKNKHARKGENNRQIKRILQPTRNGFNLRELFKAIKKNGFEFVAKDKVAALRLAANKMVTKGDVIFTTNDQNYWWNHDKIPQQTNLAL